jgi:hypothetical protein
MKLTVELIACEMHMCIVSDVPREICETSFLYGS